MRFHPPCIGILDAPLVKIEHIIWSEVIITPTDTRFDSRRIDMNIFGFKPVLRRASLYLGGRTDMTLGYPVFWPSLVIWGLPTNM